LVFTTTIPARSAPRHTTKILDQVGHLNRNAVTSLEPGTVLQPAGKLGRKSVKIGITQGVTDAAARRLVAIGRQRLLEQGHDGGVATGINALGIPRASSCAASRSGPFPS